MFIWTIFFSFLLTMHGKIETRDFTYEADGVKLKGYLAYDKSIEGKRPGVLVVHEWYGHNDYARRRAEMLAELGYVALALDMYGDGKTADHPKDAGKFAGEVMSNMTAMQARFNAALEVLRKDDHVDADNLAAIGYCFGGGVVLNMARSGSPLKGVVSFHGSLGTATPAEKGKVKAKVLVCNGADDSFVSQEAIENFRKEMDAAGVDYQFISYEKAIHSFTNPASTEIGKKYGIQVAYNKEADEKSWKDMQDFFREIFPR
jgi:dienelactone hydrolase